MSEIDRRKFILAGVATTAMTASCARAFPSGEKKAELGQVRAIRLKVDYRYEPLGLGNVRPCLSWALKSSRRGVKQTAYRILVASSAEGLSKGAGDLWDSGRVDSSKSIGIAYGGSELVSRQRCWWSVIVWDDRGVISPQSKPSCWEMGLLERNDWKAEWLAIEDPVSKGDREAGLNWIWGNNDESGVHYFQGKFLLPSDARSGFLFAVANDFRRWTQIARIWIDGRLISRNSLWPDNFSEEKGAESDAHSVDLPFLDSGEHWISLEVNSTELPSAFEGLLQRAVAVFVRFDLVNGGVLRVGSGADWAHAHSQAASLVPPAAAGESWSAAHLVSLRHQPLPPGCAMYVRKEFSIARLPTRARLYVTALGSYEGRLNGSRVGDALLTPDISQYDKRVLYQTYDVTRMLRVGRNAIGFTVGDGWYASFDGRFAWAPPPRRIIAQLECSFPDGAQQIIGTMSGWQTAESPIRRSEMRVGEVYDARLEQSGWDRPGFDASGWQPAMVAAPPLCRVVAQTNPPIRAMQTLKPRSITQPRSGIYVFDFVQSFAGFCRLHVRGERGQRIELEFSERLNASGEVEQSYDADGLPKKDIYILRGDSAGESFAPLFSYRGIRYVQVSGLLSAPTLETLAGISIHTDLETTGRFATDSSLLNGIWHAAVWARRSASVGFPTDCPRREQRGWTMGAGVVWDTAAYDMDVHAFTDQYMDAIVDGQSAEGAFPALAPSPLYNNFAWNLPGTIPSWGDAGIILPWTSWQRYGDLSIVKRHFDVMQRHIQYVLTRNPSYLWKAGRNMDLGDWLALYVIKRPNDLPETSRELLATAYWAHSADLLSQMAGAIGRVEDAQRLRDIFRNVRDAFNNAYVKPNGTVGDESQTSYVLALAFNLLPEGVRQLAAARLATDVRRRGTTLTTGVQGSALILDALADSGYADLAYELLLQTKFPSWGYMINAGATTLWETWSGKLEDGVNVTPMALNHGDLGSMGGFLFRRVVGIEPATPGFERVNIRPTITPRLKEVSGSFESIMGRIAVAWRWRSGASYSLDVTVPPNVQASVRILADQSQYIREGRRDLQRSEDVHIVGRTGHEVMLDIGSGEYSFLVAPQAASRTQSAPQHSVP